MNCKKRCTLDLIIYRIDSFYSREWIASNIKIVSYEWLSCFLSILMSILYSGTLLAATDLIINTSVKARKWIQLFRYSEWIQQSFIKNEIAKFVEFGGVVWHKIGSTQRTCPPTFCTGSTSTKRFVVHCLQTWKTSKRDSSHLRIGNMITLPTLMHQEKKLRRQTSCQRMIQSHTSTVVLHWIDQRLSLIHLEMSCPEILYSADLLLGITFLFG